MAHIRVEQIIPAAVQTVWDDIATLSSHVEWMADAESITFLTDQESGAGTRMEVLTKVGPLSTTDVMEFTEWVPPTRMAITHQGLVTGKGAFTLYENGHQTRFVWEEELTFPAYLGGPVTAAGAAPILRAIWRRNLRRLAERF
jgi:uncharacterized protein YndB with AHSA1/START domain